MFAIDLLSFPPDLPLVLEVDEACGLAAFNLKIRNDFRIMEVGWFESGFNPLPVSVKAHTIRRYFLEIESFPFSPIEFNGRAVAARLGEWDHYGVPTRVVLINEVRESERLREHSKYRRLFVPDLDVKDFEEV